MFLITYLFIFSYTFYIFICHNNTYLWSRGEIGREGRREGGHIVEECHFLFFFYPFNYKSIVIIIQSIIFRVPLNKLQQRFPKM